MIRLALIGLGRWGSNIARTISVNSRCEVVVICDPHATNEQIEPLFAGKKTPEIISSPEILHTRSDIDAVLIATPGSTHASTALPFIEKGLPVFIEKPLTTTLADAESLQAAAEKSGSLVFVGHIHLYNGAYQKVKELLPTLGDIRHLAFEGMNNGPYRSDMSALWDWAPHDIAMALDLLQTKPSEIKGWNFELLRPGKNLPDVAIAALTFPQNISVTLHINWISPEKRKKLTIIGEKSSLVFDDTAEKKITLYENMGPTVTEQTVERQEPAVSFPEYDKTSPLEKEMVAFLHMIEAKQPPLTSISQAVEVVRIIEGLERA